MKNSKSITAAVILAAGTASITSAATWLTTGVYDEQTLRTNSVENVAGATNASTAAVTYTAGVPTAPTSYSDFRSAVATAFTNNRGGVFGADVIYTATGEQRVVNGNIPGQTSFDLRYGAGGYSTGKNLAITSSSVDVSTNPSSYSALSGATGLGSTNGLSTTMGNALQLASSGQATFTFGAIKDVATNATLNEYVSSAGFTILSRNNASFTASNAVVTATFVNLADNTTSQATLSSFIDKATGTDDTFFLFTAPAGQKIGSLAIQFQDSNGVTLTSAAQTGIDDFAFITVPEPSALALAAPTLLLLGRRRTV